jgi:NADH-ubiquinone oxidoreductase chain 3
VEFAPICVYLVINLLLSFILVKVFVLFASSSSLAYLEKLLIYECDFDPIDDVKSCFDIQFYLVSIIFIVFDLEITFLFPWAISLNKIGLFGFWFMIVFLLILMSGFIYEWKNSALDWE